LGAVVGDSPKGEHHFEINHYSNGFNGTDTTFILKTKRYKGKLISSITVIVSILNYNYKRLYRAE
jgi:hypothetical protein